ncbi:hypothetical protein L596_010074 [Steinernema carpocapsae]|uniref:C2H2-type domain-containing protein n=1 Tax=Steinernema carpocapsae TaxID=34508 RepID=A0A4U5PH86_STECR|nr:hypothetical protein L596_010074 [Steinernema carpocapsae]
MTERSTINPEIWHAGYGNDKLCLSSKIAFIACFGCAFWLFLAAVVVVRPEMGHENRSETARIVEALVYNHVKRLNPGALVGIFSKERCRELERDDHHYSSKSLPKMLRFYHKKVLEMRNTISPERAGPKRCPAKIPAKQARIQEIQVKPEELKRELPRKRKMTEPVMPNRSQKVHKKLKPMEQTLEDPKRELFGHEKFCELPNLKKATNLALFSHFTRKSQDNVLEELFSQEERERYRSLDESINVPTIKRMLLLDKIEKLRVVKRAYMPIWKCQLCKTTIKGILEKLLQHIGQHEDLSCYCFIDGCDKYFKSEGSLLSHLQSFHNLMVSDMNSHQYHRLREIKENYLLEARKYLDRYFPPESFVGFCDQKRRDRAKFENSECRKCGKMVRSATPRRNHVAGHISALFECVLTGCNFLATTSTFSQHLKRVHSKKTKDLTEEELFEYKTARLKFTKTVNNALPDYFPYKTKIEEEE